MNVRNFVPGFHKIICVLAIFPVGFFSGSCKDDEEKPGLFFKVSTLAGGDTPGLVDGIGSMAKFNHPSGIALDPAGNLYVSDHSNHTIRKITPRGVVSTFAGTGVAGFVDGHRSEAMFNYPYGLAIDNQGNLYVGDVVNHKIRKISSDGMVITLAGNKKGFADLNGTLAMFNHPYGIAVDAQSNVYVADSFNNRIRKISPSGQVSKIAGNLKKGFADGTPSEAQFYYPFGIAVDLMGIVYVGDQFNHRIRKIN